MSPKDLDYKMLERRWDMMQFDLFDEFIKKYIGYSETKGEIEGEPKPTCFKSGAPYKFCFFCPYYKYCREPD